MDTNSPNTLKLYLREVSDAVNAVLRDLGGEETRFLLYIENEGNRSLVGNVNDSNCLPTLQRMIAECERRQRLQQGKPALNS